LVIIICGRRCGTPFDASLNIAGLRKVTNDMKTHKNPSLRDQPGAKPAPSPKPSVAAKPQPQKPAAAHPPKCALEGKKWIVVSVALSMSLILSLVGCQ